MLFESGRRNRWLETQMDTLNVQGIPRGDLMAANLRLLMEGRGSNIGSWFMDLTQPTYRYHDGASAGLGTAVDIINNDKGFDHNLAQSILTYAASDSSTEQAKQAICSKLKNQSLQSLTGARAAQLPPVVEPVSMPGSYPVTFLNTCAKCHDAGMAAFPSIPFGHPHRMRQWLSSSGRSGWLRVRVNGDEASHMPPIRFLSDVEKGEILNFLAQY